MIRPITCVCFLLACGSGLYLYQAKHRVQVLDRQIEQTVQATDTMREQTRVLHAEWTLLNDPERLQALAEQFLTLKTVAPSQFTSMADLDSRLAALFRRAANRRRQPEPAADAGGAGRRTGGGRTQPERLPTAGDHCRPATSCRNAASRPASPRCSAAAHCRTQRPAPPRRGRSAPAPRRRGPRCRRTG